jgi:prefoldin subunit 4
LQCIIRIQKLLLTYHQLTREEEEAMGEEKEVRKEDQDRINRFSRLHSREKLIEEDLKTKQASPSCI